MAAPVFAAASDTRRIHVSFSTGNDSTGDGTVAAPYKSLAVGYGQLREGFPDWLMLKCGDEWGLSGGSDFGYFTGWSKSGRSFKERMVVTSYGTGAMPKLNSGVHDGLQIDLAAFPQHVTFSDIHFFANTYTGAEGAIKGVSFLGTSNDISFDYLRIVGYGTGVNVQGYLTGRHTNLRFYRCTILDTYSTDDLVNAEGLLVGQTDGLTVYECILDRNGWNTDIVGSTPLVFRRNIYINNGNTNVFCYGNICARTDGMQVRCGGLLQDNLSCECVCSFHVGYGDPGSVEPGGVTAYLVRNVGVDGIPLSVALPGVFGIRASNLIGGEARENLIARATSMSDPKCFWYSTIPNGVGGHISNRVANNFAQVRNRFYEAGKIVMEGDASQYSMNTIDACLHQSDTTPASVVVEAGANGTFDQFACSIAPNQWHGAVDGTSLFRCPGADLLLARWNEIVFGTDSIGTTNFPDPTRSPATYMGTIGFAATYAAFYTQLRLQSRQAWNESLNARNINNYIRSGFGM